MNRRSQRMKSLIRIAAHQRERAAKTLAEARRKRDQADATLDLLRMHFEDYRQRLNQPRPAGSMAQLREFQHFVHRLGQAIEQQQTALEQADARCQEELRNFLSRHTRYRALEQAHGRLQAQERRQQEKRGQQQMDERAIFKKSRNL